MLREKIMGVLLSLPVKREVFYSLLGYSPRTPVGAYVRRQLKQGRIPTGFINRLAKFLGITPLELLETLMSADLGRIQQDIKNKIADSLRRM